MDLPCAQVTPRKYLGSSHGLVKPRDVTNLVNHDICSSVGFDRRCRDYRDFDQGV